MFYSWTISVNRMSKHRENKQEINKSFETPPVFPHTEEIIVNMQSSPWPFGRPKFPFILMENFKGFNFVRIHMIIIREIIILFLQVYRIIHSARLPKSRASVFTLPIWQTTSIPTESINIIFFPQLLSTIYLESLYLLFFCYVAKFVLFGVEVTGSFK